MKEGLCEQDVIDLILRNIHIVGYGIIGCSECPFSSPSIDGMGQNDINIADPDEGHYECELTNKHRVWGEDPACEDKDWADWFRELLTDDMGLST